MSSIASQLSFSKARDIVGGATGSIPYQTANSSTVFVPIGSNGFVLTSNGTTATWTAASGVSAGSAAQVATITASTNSNYFLTFVDSNNGSSANETVYTSGSIIFNPGTGSLGIGASPTATARLTISQTYSSATGAESFPLVISGNYSIADTSLKQVIRSNYGGLHTSGVQATGINLLALASINGVGGVTTNAYNYWSRIDNSTNATVTNAFNFYVENGSGSGGPVNLYGLYVGSLTKGTSNFAVYTAGTTPSFFGGNTVFNSDVAIQGGDLFTNQATFNLVNTTATTINFGGASTAMTIGANAAGTVTIRNNTNATSTATGGLVVYGGVGIGGNLYVGGTINGTAGNANNLLTTATTTASTYFLTFVDSNNTVAAYEAVYTDAGLTYNPSTDLLTVSGDIAVNGGDITSTQTAFNLLNATVTTASVLNSGTAITIGELTGFTAVRNQFTVTNATSAISTLSGALQVRGGVGVGGSLYVGNRVGFVNTSNVSAVYQIYNAALNSLDTVFA